MNIEGVTVMVWQSMPGLAFETGLGVARAVRTMRATSALELRAVVEVIVTDPLAPVAFKATTRVELRLSGRSHARMLTPGES